MLLGVNIDHVATLRNARGGGHPDILRVAVIVEQSGADIITMHLREDRRHIKDHDVFMVKEVVNVPINFEMAATEEMLEIALKLKPYSCCIVPEKREELTTEGGLDLRANKNLLRIIDVLSSNGIEVNLFVEPDIKTLHLAKDLNVRGVEIHTGKYANLFDQGRDYKNELSRIIAASLFCQELELKCNIGHGLDLANILNLLTIPNISEIHIGHFIIGEAIFLGLADVIREFKELLLNKAN